MNEKMEAYLKKYAKETGKTMDELDDILERAKARLERLGLAGDERALQGQFRRMLRGSIYGKGGKRRTAQEFFGFVFGVSRLIDWDEMRRIKALKRFSSDPTNAQLEGLVDEAGNPMDNRPKIYKWGKEVDNPNYRKPLVGHSYDRKVFGIAKLDGTEEPKVFRLNLRGRTAKEFKGWKPFVPVRFLALVYGDDTFYELYPTRLTKFSTDKEAKIDIEKWIGKANHIYKLDKLDQAYNATHPGPKLRAKDPWVFLEADVDYINPEIDEDRKQRNISITDDNIGLQTYRVRLSEDVPISFSEFSRVIVMGEIQKYLRRDGKEGVSIEGYGVYPLPGKSVEIPSREEYPAEGPQEEPIILWD